MDTSIDELSVSNLKVYKFTNQGDQFIENGHVVFHEERLRIENHKLVNQAIIKFRDWRVAFESENSSVNATDIPQQFTHLIALLAHESDETLDVLAHRINNILTPFEKNDQVFNAFFDAIKQIIRMTVHQERYGLADVILLLKDSPPAIPKRLTIYRWQAYDTTKFPADIRQAATKKRERRKLFSRLFTDAFQSLPKSARINLLFDENGNFIDSGSKPTKELAFNLKDNRRKNILSLEKEEADTTKNLFSSFKQDEHVSIAPPAKVPHRRICSSFETLFYIGLSNSFDLRQRFLDELSPSSKRRRGIENSSNTVQINMKKAWLESTTARIGKKNYFYDTPMYKSIRSLKTKLIQFHEDVRPAYYGTWSKAYNGRNIVNGRRPFAKDTEVLNYDYDSEAEWDHDVDCDDIHTLDPDEDDDMLFPDSADEEDEGEGDNHETRNDEDEEEEVKWVVPEGYLSEDEGIHDRRRQFRTRRRIVSRPAKWPISGNKHFPMKPVILGPSFESIEEPENHPLSDFKIHMLVDLETDHLGYSPFNRIISSNTSTSNNAVEEDLPKAAPLTACFEPNKVKPPLFQREIDKIVNSYKEELINIILDNKTKTMMGLVSVLKSKKMFTEYTTAQLQAMIHDVAIQEMRGSNKEYNWYLRVASSSVS